MRCNDGRGELMLELIRVGDQRIVAGDTLKDGKSVGAGTGGFLQSPSSKRIERSLGGNNQQGHIIRMGRSDTGHQIGSAWAGGSKTYPHLASHTVVTIRHKSTAGFMTAHHTTRASPPCAAG